MRKAALVLLLLGATLSAQTRFDEAFEVSIVNVDVIVTEKDGKRVTGLTVEDFELLEGGKLQPLTNFAEYRRQESAGTVSVETAPTNAVKAEAGVPRTRRTIVLFMEIARLLPFQAKELIGSIRDLLHETVAPGDRVTIVTWLDAMEVRQPYTDDLAVLDGVLSTLEAEHVRGPRDLARNVRREQAASDADAAAMAASLRDAGVVGSSEGMPALDSFQAAKRQQFAIRRKAMALEGLMQSISGLDGRKIVIMAMRRFGLHAGVEFYGGRIPLEDQGTFDTKPIRDSLVRTANAHGITLYPVYAPGIRWDPDDASVTRAGILMEPGNDAGLENNVMMNETTALHEVAVKTGGLAAWGSANIAALLPRVADDLETYYSLGYRSRATGKDIARDIVVKTKDPRYTVRSRRQFVEKSDESLMNDRVLANLYERIEGSAIAFELGFGEVRSIGRKRWSLPIKIRIPVDSLMTVARGRQQTGEFSVYVVAGAAATMSDVRRQTQPFRIPAADLQRVKSTYFTYDVTLHVDEKVDRISVGVMDEVSKQFGLKRFALPDRGAK